MSLNFLVLLLLISSRICAEIGEREEIVTISSSTDEDFVTTGNGSINQINYEKMHNAENKPTDGTVDPLTIEQLNRFSNFKNRLIIDFPREDSKRFQPDLPDYYKVASTRGFIFTFVSVALLFSIFATFYLRIFSGECGGYKTIIRKPSKALRYTVFTRMSVGVIVFAVGFTLTSYLAYSDRKIAFQAAEKLQESNIKQLNQIEWLIKEIKRINKIKFNVIYSILSYEHFRIGQFISDLTKVYTQSLEKAEEVNRILFYGTKNNVFLKLLVVLIILGVILISWFFVYKDRKLTNALSLAFLAGILAVYMFHVLGSSFNYFSIFTEMCKESIEIFDPVKGDLRVRFDNSFQNFLTCLPQKETELMTAQMNSLLIGENTLLLVLRNFFKNVDNTLIPGFGGLDGAVVLDVFKDKIREQVLDHTQVDGKTDTLLRQNLLHVLEVALRIPKLYSKANKLHNCFSLSQWSKELNESMCASGVLYQYYSLFSFFVAILGVLIVCIAIFSSENIIRGLYNEEIQYVKTNKLRYDWN